MHNYTMDMELISHIKNHITFFPLSSVELVPTSLRAPIDNRQLFASEGATLSDINQ